MKIGAQFFTLRDFCQTPEGLSESLKKVAEIGYPCVQLAGTFPFDFAWVKGELEKNGLTCPLTHALPESLKKDPAGLCEKHDLIGAPYIGLGWYGHNEQDPTEAFLPAYRETMRVFKENGKLFMMHNHDQEFQKIEGRPILQWLSEQTAPDELGFTLDTFWVQAGGGDPAEWMEKLSGRIPCIHLKDFAYGRKMAVLGEGNINFDRVFEKAESAGVRYAFVEQDDCNGEDPFDCLRRSFAYLRSRGLV